MERSLDGWVLTDTNSFVKGNLSIKRVHSSYSVINTQTKRQYGTYKTFIKAYKKVLSLEKVLYAN